VRPQFLDEEKIVPQIVALKPRRVAPHVAGAEYRCEIWTARQRTAGNQNSSSAKPGSEHKIRRGWRSLVERAIDYGIKPTDDDGRFAIVWKTPNGTSTAPTTDEDRRGRCSQPRHLRSWSRSTYVMERSRTH
jgi:hypothetical protein